MLDQELFVVSNFGTTNQEFEKYLIIEKAIESSSSIKKYNNKCTKI